MLPATGRRSERGNERIFHIISRTALFQRGSAVERKTNRKGTERKIESKIENGQFRGGKSMGRRRGNVVREKFQIERGQKSRETKWDC